MDKATEKRLIKEAIGGSVSAFESLVKTHQQKVYSFALSITGGHTANAADIYQEAVIKAFLNIKSFKGNSSFSTWLWVIAKNTFRDWIKKPYHNKIVANTDNIIVASEENQEENYEKSESSLRLRKMIAQLPFDYAEAVTLVHLQELTYEEAAQTIGIKVNLLKVRVHRAKQKLTDMLLEQKKEWL